MKPDISILGGKGASLVEMIQAGFSVPPFFVVPAGALDEKEILAEFKKLKTKRVAVRSSATAEDSLSASWAGMLKSYLNTEEEDLIKNIEKCRVSINSPRAISYRKQKGLNKQKISVAVIVQKMIQSETSGVCFTFNPVTGNRNEMVIEADRGLGDKIVGGKITPVTYTINKKLLIPGINSFRVVIHRQKLSNRQIIKLAELCQKIEKLFKYSQDIEWAFAKGKFYILQSRPITTFVGNWGAGLDYLLKDCWNGLDKIVEDNFYGRHNKKLITSLSAKVFLALNEAVLIMKKYGDWVKKAKVIKEFGASAKSLNARVIFIDAVTQFLRETSMGAVKIVKVNKAKTTDKKTATEDIKGVVASAGKLVAVNGTAKIIFREDDFSKIKKGDILITKETSSDFLPAIIKAKAIVTDLGGILCHAAIVARELKKPCIVGTKIATQVLKDGDSIEVDLKNGTVYKR
ncbi:hypothetical protein A3K33_01400 [Candidatus Azambacteria bacterium RIFOXYC1_FULL_41_20]|nr:MAG: Pyruvate phosphate dikinase, PEP/pyruvate binding domain protein [Candidatus Azambacteria bacterium GW2011_GWF2_42_22]KKT03136.1 MAG: Pyruvate phosphate dikinase, PEP/pyruvate binding domain protein [Candidatus Azambacteria bacterium GW2011_GWD1_43_18]KKT12074.1 MAG: Pyruvate phosphate dikinase, PEP/pyruvate binding domain protein [Candidatus Azambacteria bacterium GW2011_GWC2_43_27]OGD41195.1 MAG: hypothetical protein A3K28_01410 [Candidatus Azambacteria bacterium RIFOXYB1_FULL_40_33]O